MNLQQAKEIPIMWFYTDILGLKGKRHGKDILFCSPFREDKNPSLSVSIYKNIAFDFATRETRDLVESVMDYYHLSNTSEALRKLSALILDNSPQTKSHYINSLKNGQNLLPDSQNQKNSINTLENQNTYSEAKIMDIKDIYYYPLKNYIKDIRKISIERASLYLKEIHFKLSNNPKTYFGLGMKNISEGCEIGMYNSRDKKTFQTCIGKKDITFIEGKNKDSKIIAVFEGRFDFLTLLEKEGLDKPENDSIVLNSIACYKRAIATIHSLKKYNEVHLYLDNDDEGKNTLVKFKKELNEKHLKQSQKLPKENGGISEFTQKNSMMSLGDILSEKYANMLRTVDKSSLYEGYKDLNDWWVEKGKS